MQRAGAALGDARGRVRNRLRTVGRRVLISGRQARSLDTRDAVVRSDRQLMATTRAVVRDASTMVRRINQRLRTASRSMATTLRQARQRLQPLQPLVTRILDQTRARLLGGDTHVPHTVLRVVEPHTEATRKGTIGKLVTIHEPEHQIITADEVHDRRPPDMTLWTPALERHLAIFNRPPDIAAADGGFGSAANEEAAIAREVRRGILPRTGRKTQHVARMRASVGSAADSVGASAAKGA